MDNLRQSQQSTSEAGMSVSTHLRAMLMSREKKPRLLTWRPRDEDDVEMEPFGAFSFRMAMVTKDEYLDLHRA